MYSFDTLMSQSASNLALVYPVPSPIRMNKEERLAVALLIEFKWSAAGGYATIGHEFDPAKNTFLINIPIIK